MQSDECFTIKSVLDDLRSEIGDSDFGYRVQGFFAHVLVRLGARVQEVNAQGHPDIKAQMGDSTWLIQVKSVLHNSALPGFELSADDIQGVKPEGRDEGFLALLDCAEPVQFIIVRHIRLSEYASRPLHIASVQADRDVGLSEECTEEFVDIVHANRSRLRNLTFRILSRRAMQGDAL